MDFPVAAFSARSMPPSCHIMDTKPMPDQLSIKPAGASGVTTIVEPLDDVVRPHRRYRRYHRRGA
jgi:hypothetical protein